MKTQQNNVPATEAPAEEIFVKVDKELTYTKSYYENLVKSSFAMFDNDTKNPKEREEIYGLYYCAIAGLIRSGALCRRGTGHDGFPEITVVIGNDTYKCNENVLDSILGTDAPEIIKPYEDTFQSYVDGTSAVVSQPATSPIDTNLNKNTKDAVDIKNLKKSHEKELDALKKKYDSMLQEANSKNGKLTQQLKTLEAAAKKNNGQNIPAPVIDDTTDKQLIAQLQEENSVLKNAASNSDGDNSAVVAQLTQENSTLNKNLIDVQGQLSSCQANLNACQSQLRISEQQAAQKSSELNEATKYAYDPNYDHYYSDILPKLIDSVEFTHSDAVAKGITVCLCVVGLVISVLFFV